MGGGNPVKKVIKKVTHDLTRPTREVARSIGADGVVNYIDKENATIKGYSDAAIDKGSGKDKRMKAAADQENQRLQGIAANNSRAAAQQAADAETSRIEGERMAGDSSTRTLLTGPQGLEDEEESISRKVLRGY